METQHTRFLSIDEVLRITGKSRTTIWRWTNAGLFPAKRKLGPNSVGWLDREVEEWVANRPVEGPGARS